MKVIWTELANSQLLEASQYYKEVLKRMSKDIEVIFLVEEAAEGGYQARAIGESIFTEADTMDQLRQNVKEAVLTHFEGSHPAVIRLHFVKEELMRI